MDPWSSSDEDVNKTMFSFFGCSSNWMKACEKTLKETSVTVQIFLSSFLAVICGLCDAFQKWCMDLVENCGSLRSLMEFVVQVNVYIRVFTICMLLYGCIICINLRAKKRNRNEEDLSKDGSSISPSRTTNSSFSEPYPLPAAQPTVFDLAKTAHKVEHAVAVIRMVEQRNFDINYPLPINGLTLFLCACLSGNRNLVSYLLKKGADITSCTSEGDSALYLATYGIGTAPNGDPAILEDLIAAGCEANHQNGNGYTALHRATSLGSLQMVKILLKNGADPSFATHTELYAMDIARRSGYKRIEKILKKYSAAADKSPKQVER